MCVCVCVCVCACVCVCVCVCLCRPPRVLCELHNNTVYCYIIYYTRYYTLYYTGEAFEFDVQDREVSMLKLSVFDEDTMGVREPP